MKFFVVGSLFELLTHIETVPLSLEGDIKPHYPALQSYGVIERSLDHRKLTW